MFLLVALALDFLRMNQCKANLASSTCVDDKLKFFMTNVHDIILSLTSFDFVIDRLRGLSRPEGSFFGISRGVKVLTFVWLVISAFNLPLFIFTDTSSTTMSNGSSAAVFCVALQRLTLKSRHVYWLTGRILVFFVPLVVTWISYAQIFSTMRNAHSKV